jgi:hypothetical protein
MAKHLEELRSKLRGLRDKVAFEAPRAHARPGTPPDIDRRLQSTLQRIVAALTAPPTVGEPSVFEELCDDIVVEAHLVLHEWERWQEESAASPKAKPRSPLTGADRRVHTRHETNVFVQILRHGLHGEDRSTRLDSESVKRPARNVSLGGMFVTLPKDELPEAGAGSVVHISVSVGDSPPFRARAAVVRRDGDGIGLHWIQENEAIKRSIKTLLEAIRRPAR